MKRDRKGRFSIPPKSEALMAEQALLWQLREALAAFGSDISEGVALSKYGVAATLTTPKAGLRWQIAANLVGLAPSGRELRIEVQQGHAGCFRYTVSIPVAENQVSQATPAAPSVGGPREVSA